MERYFHCNLTVNKIGFGSQTGEKVNCTTLHFYSRRISIPRPIYLSSRLRSGNSSREKIIRPFIFVVRLPDDRSIGE